MPNDDPLSRPAVRALLEAVAAGDDPTAAQVLADVLDEAGADAATIAAVRFHRIYAYEVQDTLGRRPGERYWSVQAGGVNPLVITRAGETVATGHIKVDGPLRPLCCALAEAADRLAARAAAEGG